MSKWYKGRRIFKGKRKQQLDITTGNAQQNHIEQPSIRSTIPHVNKPTMTGGIPKVFTSRKKDRKGKRRKRRSDIERIRSNIQQQEEKREKQQLKSARDTETDRIARILIQGDYAGDSLLNTVLAEYDQPAMSWQEADAKTGKINSHVVETREQYRRLAHMAMKYKSIDELEKAIKSSKGITRTALKHIRDIALAHPELYNEPALNVSRETYDSETNNGHTEQLNDDNTADSRRLIYDTIVSMINEGLNSPERYVRFCAGYLMDTLDAEIVQYGDKAYQAIEACDGTWLIEDCRVFIFDSESWKDKLARLESILALIHGHMPSDEEREQFAIWSDALDDFEDY